MDQLQEASGSPTGDRPRRLHAGVVGIVAAALLVAIILVGLGIAGAQTPSPTPSPETKTPKALRLKGPGGGWFGRGVLHGEFVTAAPGGGYQTLAAQTGEVTSVSASSIAVRSEDGFARTYGVDDNTLVNAGNNGISDVKTGDQVRILAVVEGDSRRAVEIIDSTTVQELRGKWRPSRAETPSASNA
jgi:hypothetical protein